MQHSASLPCFDMAPSIATKTSRFESSPKLPASEQWKRTLQDIKLLYIQRQYKRCVARSSAILNTSRDPIHPVYKSYLYFYSAISYEAMGRYAHNYSINKLPLLHSALDCFVTCLAVLPSIIPFHGADPQTPSYTSLGESSSTSDLSETLSPTESIVSSITDIIDMTLDCSEDDPFLSDNDGADLAARFYCKGPDNPIYHDEPDEESLMPSPLHVRKPSTPLINNSNNHRNLFQNADVDLPAKANDTKNTGRSGPGSGRARPPPLLPIKVVPFGARILDSSKGQLQLRGTFTEREPEPMTLRREAAVKTYNTSIQFLYSQINSSIASIHKVIDEVAEIRHARKTSKSFERSASFWSFSPVKDSSSSSSSSQENNTSHCSTGNLTRETMQERIARLRAEGWKTVGVKSTKRGWKGAAYYKAFCASVLDELYLDARV